jgi:hypothetical protein
LKENKVGGCDLELNLLFPTNLMKVSRINCLWVVFDNLGTMTFGQLQGRFLNSLPPTI